MTVPNIFLFLKSHINSHDLNQKTRAIISGLLFACCPSCS